jgi:hypothetical protein
MRWGLLDRSRRKSEPAPRRTFRPTLEALETRDCPSPVITSFSASPTNAPGSRQVELRGTVSDVNPQQDTVTFTGQVGGQATPDASGNFDYIGSAGGLGNVTAVATGFVYSPTPHQVSSAPVTALITSAAPTITSFNVIQSGGGTWTFSGHVSDEAPMGIVVQFGGAWQACGLSATVDGSGNFSATFYLPTLTSGSITAQCTDVWGLLSNTVIDPIV